MLVSGGIFKFTSWLKCPESQLFKSGFISSVGPVGAEIQSLTYSSFAHILQFQRSRSLCGNLISLCLKMDSYTLKGGHCNRNIKTLYISVWVGKFCVSNLPLRTPSKAVIIGNYLPLIVRSSRSIDVRDLKIGV